MALPTPVNGQITDAVPPATAAATPVEVGTITSRQPDAADDADAFVAMLAAAAKGVSKN